VEKNKLSIVNKKILLVCSPYYEDITNNLIEGASGILKSKNYV